VAYLVLKTGYFSTFGGLYNTRPGQEAQIQYVLSTSRPRPILEKKIQFFSDKLFNSLDCTLIEETISESKSLRVLIGFCGGPGEVLNLYIVIEEIEFPPCYRICFMKKCP